MNPFLRFLIPFLPIHFGGGGSTTTQSNEPPEYTIPHWQNYLNTMAGLTASPIPVYGGPTVAPWNFTQQTAADMGYNLATGGTPALNAANSQIAFQAMGGGANPFATLQNPYMGDSPYLQSLIDSTNKDISRNFATGTAAQTDAAFNRSNAFGGSAYEDQTAKNARSLADSIAGNTSNIRQQNYLNSANLAENLLNRSTSAFQNQQQNALNAAGLGLQSGQNEWNNINSLLGLGNAQQGYGQNVLNAAQQYFGNTVMSPFNTAELMGQALARASGGQGTTTTTGPGQNPWMQGIGGALMLAALFG